MTLIESQESNKLAESAVQAAVPVEAPEKWFKRYLLGLIALAVAAGWMFFLYSFWAPAPSRPGIDENAYLLGGRNIAEHGTVGFKPASDFEFVGHMWLMTKDQTFAPPGWVPNPLRRWLTAHTKADWFYPKYPAGLPLLNAIAIKLGGAHHGREWALLISPVCMTGAVLGMFFLARTMVGSFYAILAMISLGAGATSLRLSELPNSHASDLCAVVWGMFLLMRWWQTGRPWRGVLAGLLLGFAVTLRYTEALLLFPLYPLSQVLSDTNLSTAHPHWWKVVQFAGMLPIGPIGIACLTRIRLRNWRSWISAALPILCWAIPVALLVSYNWFAMGHITGYDATNESIGFSTKEFLRKWDFAVYQLYMFGAFLLMPLGIAGLILMFRQKRTPAAMLNLWFVPGMLLYMAYYWGEGTPGVAFLRFLLSVFPPVIIAAMWMLREASGKRSITGPLAAGILTAAAASIGLWSSLPTMQRQHRGNLNLHYSDQIIERRIGAIHNTASAPIIFCGEGFFPQLLQYMQFMVDGEWYAADSFEPRMGGGFGILGVMNGNSNNKSAPRLLQKDRIEYMDAMRKGKTEADLVAEQHRMIDAAIASGRKVYAILTPVQRDDFRKRYLAKVYQFKELEHWVEPVSINVNDEKNSDLSLKDQFGEPFIEWQPQTLGLYEILPAGPATQPTNKTPAALR